MGNDDASPTCFQTNRRVTLSKSPAESPMLSSRPSARSSWRSSRCRRSDRSAAIQLNSNNRSSLFLAFAEPLINDSAYRSFENVMITRAVDQGLDQQNTF